MKRVILTRILLLSAILSATCLMASNAQAMGSDTSLNLQYEVLEGETLYAVATADGDLRFFNQGPGALRVRWYDSLGGKKDQQDLGPGKSLLTYGSLGAQISEGTIVLIEQVGPDVLSRGFASLPATPSLHDSIHCLHNNGAFLPWHRGYLLFSSGWENPSNAQTCVTSLEHGPGMHDSVHCLVGGTMCSARSSNDPIFIHQAKISPDGCVDLLFDDGTVLRVAIPPIGTYFTHLLLIITPNGVVKGP